MEPSTQPDERDEVSPIAAYILKEIARNAVSRDALQIKNLNAMSATDCYATYQAMPWWQQLFSGSYLQACNEGAASAKLAALAAWALQVRQNGPWDHKPYIGKTYKYHAYYQGRTYYYDIWSNIHYGFVGRACGFSRGELLDGAGLEQIGSDLFRGTWPSAQSGVDGLRRFDDASDRLSIQIGIDLHPHVPSVATLLQVLVKTPGLSP